MDNENNKTTKRNPFKLILILVIVIAVATGLSYFTYTQYQTYQHNSFIEKYYQASPDEIDTLFTISDSEDLMFDTEAYKSFENACLGNTNNNLLAMGFYAKRGTIECHSSETTVAVVDEKEITITDHPSSYINIINNYIYYRDDSDRKIYRNSLDDNESECIVDANCGEIVVTAKGIYYIDFATKKLNYLAFSNDEPNQVYDNRIISFAVIGECCFVLNEDKSFGFLKLNKDYTEIDSDVDTFFFDGSIYIQKGSKVYRLNSFTDSDCVIDNIEGFLIYESAGYLYISDNEKITRIPVNGEGEPQEIYSLKENEIVKSIIETSSSCEIKIFTEKDGILYEKPVSNNQ